MAWFQITLCLSNLMLTGSATPFLHNGILPCLYTEESNFDFGEGKVGVKRLCRSVCRVGVPAGGHHWAEWYRVPAVGPGREDDGGGWPRLPPQDPRPAHLDHLRQRQLGRPLQPQQGPHEVLRGREQVHSIDTNPSLSLQQLLARFNLYYYSNTPIKEKIDTILLIDTRNNRNFGKHNIELNDDFDGVEENPLEKAIQSKLVSRYGLHI